jgi:hypothetical protein
MRCYHRPLQFSILLVSLLFACAPTEAKDLPIQGGPGGSYFRSECGAGQWVIGVTIRHGLWVDAMRLICAGYSSISRVVPDFDLDFQGQQGGSLTPATVICSNDTYVTGIKFGTTWDGNDPKYVDYVEVTCASVVVFSGTPPFAVYGLIGTSTCLDTGEGCSNQPFSLSCDLGDAATGFHGRSGIYVDALGLICGPSPALVAATSQAPPTGTPPPPPQLTPDQITYLNAHNERRAKHCVPKLTVSLELERAAKAWADACVYEHDESIRGSVGENIAAAWPTLTSTKAIGDWYDEIGRYDFDHPIDSYKAALNADPTDHTKEVRHFTQVVWKATREVGCAMANCEAPTPDGTNSVWKFFVCRYSPPGNINGTDPGVLEENVPRLSPEPCPK